MTALTDTQRTQLLDTLNWIEQIEDKPRQTGQDKKELKELEKKVSILLT